MDANHSKRSRLILIGAGPGDAEMITLKAINALKSADVVLYDALVNVELLGYCSAFAKCVYVGKRKGMHYVQQYYINKMIIRYGKKCNTVVRLKGGDPFVFGRGFEEMTYAKKHGMEVEYIPGISSAVAVPPLAGIPLSIRGVNACITIVTATTKNGGLSEELKWAVSGNGTVVVLMGVSKLKEIAALVSESRGSSEIMAVLSKGSQVDARRLFAPAFKVYEESLKQPVETPAVIVVGKVVTYALELMEADLSENLTTLVK